MDSSINKLKIAVVDDSDFYNSILTRHINNTASKLIKENDLQYEISSYLHADDFLRNYPKDCDVVILDYFLGDGYTGYKVLEQLDPLSNNIKIAVISSQKNIHTSYITVSKGAMTFISKDKALLSNVSLFLEDIINGYYLNK